MLYEKRLKTYIKSQINGVYWVKKNQADLADNVVLVFNDIVMLSDVNFFNEIYKEFAILYNSPNMSEGSSSYYNNLDLLGVFIKYGADPYIDEGIIFKKIFKNNAVKTLRLIHDLYKEDEDLYKKIIFEVKKYNKKGSDVFLIDGKKYDFSADMQGIIRSIKDKKSEKILLTDSEHQKNINDMILEYGFNYYGFLSIKIDKYCAKHKISADFKRGLLNVSLDFSVENKMERAIDVLLGKKAHSVKYCKEIFINALKNKDLNRVLKMWDYKTFPLDLSVYISIKTLEKVENIYKSKDFASFEDFLGSGNNSVAQFDRVMSIANMIFKNTQSIMLESLFKPNDSLDYYRNSFIGLIKDDIELIKKNNQLIDIPKEIIATPIIKAEVDSKKIENILTDNVNSPNIVTKQIEELEENIPLKPIRKLVSLNGESLTRKEIQKRWDLLLIHAFYEQDNISIESKRAIFYNEQGLNAEILKLNDVTIHRMPKENSVQLSKKTRDFICSCIPSLSEILFKENAKSVILKENNIIKRIIEKKIRTSSSPIVDSSGLSKSEKKELKESQSIFSRMVLENYLSLSSRDEKSKHNWSKIK